MDETKTDDNGIPDFLRVENRKPLTAEQQAKVDAIRKNAETKIAARKVAAAEEFKESPKADSVRGDKDGYKKEKVVKVKPAKIEKKSAKASNVIRGGREGLVAVAALCAEYGLTGREARQRLREAKVKKPVCGWAYAKNDEALKKVREILKAPAARKAVGKKAKAEPTRTGKAKVTKAKSPVKAASGKTAVRAETKKLVAKAKKAGVKVVKIPAGKK